MSAFPTRAKLAIVLLAAICTLSSLKLVPDAWEQRAVMAAEPGTSVPAYVARFDEIRKALLGQGVIGYITDQVRDPNRAIAEYHLTQFAMVPVLVTNSWNEKYVIGNFHRPLSPAAVRTKGLEFVHDYGGFVQLLRNRSKRSAARRRSLNGMLVRAAPFALLRNPKR